MKRNPNVRQSDRNDAQTRETSGQSMQHTRRHEGNAIPMGNARERASTTMRYPLHAEYDATPVRPTPISTQHLFLLQRTLRTHVFIPMRTRRTRRFPLNIVSLNHISLFRLNRIYPHYRESNKSCEFLLEKLKLLFILICYIIEHFLYLYTFFFVI